MALPLPLPSMDDAISGAIRAKNRCSTPSPGQQKADENRSAAQRCWLRCGADVR